MHGEIRNVQNIFSGKPKGMRPLRSHRHTWKDNIKMDERMLTGFIWFRIETDGKSF
jgi:hypothetical protein